MNSWDVVLIGSGISSLTSGLLLARAGKRVCILEQHVKPGGYLHCFKRFGLRYETGGHYVGSMEKGQPFRTLLEYLEVYDDALFTPLDPQGYDVFRFPSFEFSFPKSYEALEARLLDFFPHEREGILKYLKRIQEAVTQFPTYTFRSEFDEMEVAKALVTPVKAVVEECVRDPKLQVLLYTYSTIHGVFPEDMSFGLHSLITDSMIRGAYGFKDGGDVLTQNFVREIEKHGGRILLRSKVERLITGNAEVKEVHLSNGEVIRGTTIISSAHPKLTFSWLPEQELKPAFRERVKNLEESEGLLGIYGYTRTPPPLNPLKNYYFFQSENPEDFLLTRNKEEDPGIIFATQTIRTTEPQEKYPVTLHTAAPISWFSDYRETKFNKRPEDYHRYKEYLASKVFSSLDRYLPGFSLTIERYEVSTPLTNLHFNGSPDGTAYGLYHSIDNTGFRAIGPRTHFKNLFLTGQNTLCPGILGSAISGLRTAGHLLGIKPILRELQHLGNAT